MPQGTFSTSEMEYYFVTDPRNDHRTIFEMLVAESSSRSGSVRIEEFSVLEQGWATLGSHSARTCHCVCALFSPWRAYCDRWPHETKLEDAPLDSTEAEWRREPHPPEKFVREMQTRNDQLVDLGAPPLIHLEFVCSRLYTGPM